MDRTTEASFKERLDSYYDWPCAYVFKFIAPADRLDRLTALFADDADLRTRRSKNGNYVSVTVERVMDDSDQVIAVYRQAAEIDGVMPL